MDIDYINHILVIGAFLFMVYHISLRYQTRTSFPIFTFLTILKHKVETLDKTMLQQKRKEKNKLESKINRDTETGFAVCGNNSSTQRSTSYFNYPFQ